MKVPIFIRKYRPCCNSNILSSLLFVQYFRDNYILLNSVCDMHTYIQTYMYAPGSMRGITYVTINIDTPTALADVVGLGLLSLLITL